MSVSSQPPGLEGTEVSSTPTPGFFVAVPHALGDDTEIVVVLLVIPSLPFSSRPQPPRLSLLPRHVASPNEKTTVYVPVSPFRLCCPSPKLLLDVTG